MSVVVNKKTVQKRLICLSLVIHCGKQTDGEFYSISTKIQARFIRHGCCAVVDYQYVEECYKKQSVGTCLSVLRAARNW